MELPAYCLQSPFCAFYLCVCDCDGRREEVGGTWSPGVWWGSETEDAQRPWDNLSSTISGPPSHWSWCRTWSETEPPPPETPASPPPLDQRKPCTPQPSPPSDSPAPRDWSPTKYQHQISVDNNAWKSKFKFDQPLPGTHHEEAPILTGSVEVLGGSRAMMGIGRG